MESAWEACSTSVSASAIEAARYGTSLEEATGVFELNSEFFPGSWNVWDSLAEACLAGDDTVRARRLYQKSLDLNPDNENAAAVLERLKVTAAESS